MATPENLSPALSAANLSIRAVKQPDQWYGEVVDVTVDLPTEGSVTFSVSGPHKTYDEDQPPSVNWSAIGSVPAEDAAVFAEALAYCASVVAPSLRGTVSVVGKDAGQLREEAAAYLARYDRMDAHFHGLLHEIQQATGMPLAQILRDVADDYEQRLS